MDSTGWVFMIGMAGYGVKIEKEIETQEMLEIRISVPEHSYRLDVHNEEIADMALAKKFKTFLTDMGVKRLVVKSRTRKGETWTQEMADAAELDMRKQLFGSQY